MARFQFLTGFQSQFQRVAYTLLMLLLLHRLTAVDAYYGQNPWEVTDWSNSHATFYGDQTGSITMGGACGYGNLWWRGYGLNTAALSNALFNNGMTCGACFEIKCDISNCAYSMQWCYPNNPSVIVTATNNCPPNWAKPSDNGGWCNPPRTHFDLSMVMFQQMAPTVAGIIPVKYRRVPCARTGGLKFTLDGNPWFNLVLIWNVAGGGDVANMQIKGDKTNWYTMSRNWGQYWECPVNFTGQKLSFMVTLCNGQVRVVTDLTSQIWYNGQSYEALTNF
ncbi:hypothetical protein R1sor_003628 [Riccia sorocarpa]|uniref:Expansin n=1 Tax=Riccia sorocarpa TaxID=122646 RepID=A0ABD3H4A7_9MARC